MVILPKPRARRRTRLPPKRQQAEVRQQPEPHSIHQDRQTGTQEPCPNGGDRVMRDRERMPRARRAVPRKERRASARLGLPAGVAPLKGSVNPCRLERADKRRQGHVGVRGAIPAREAHRVRSEAVVVGAVLEVEANERLRRRCWLPNLQYDGRGVIHYERS